MSTYCAVIIKTGKKYKVNTVKYDGYLTGVGSQLQTYFGAQNIDKLLIREMRSISNGEVDMYMKGDDEREITTFTSLKKAIASLPNWYRIYFWRGDYWYYYETPTSKCRSLDVAIKYNNE